MQLLRNIVALTVLSSCNQEAGRAPNSAEPAGLVARIGEVTITTTDLESYIAKQPAALQLRYATPQGKTVLLKQLVRFEVLADEAEKSGHRRRPEVQRQIKQLIINSLIDTEIGAPKKPSAVSQAETDSYFKEHAAEFKRDEVRIEQVVVKTRQTADQIAVNANRATDRQSGFARLATAHASDEAARPHERDLGFFAATSDQYPRPVIEAAFGLRQANEIVGPVQSEQGFHVLRLIERRTDVTPPFAALETGIKTRIAAEARANRLEAWTAEIQGRTKVELFEDRLAGVRVQPEKTPIATKGTP